MNSLDLKHDKVILENLNLKPVLELDLIIYAWKSPTNLRVVNIVDTRSHYKTLKSSANPKNDHVAVGKAANVDLAFRRALVSFHKGVKHDEFYHKLNVKTLLRDADKTTSMLDYWILNHEGTMTASRDEDGYVIVKLDGRANVSELGTVTFIGKGTSLMRALDSAFKSNPYKPAKRITPIVNKPTKITLSTETTGTLPTKKAARGVVKNKPFYLDTANSSS